MDDSIMSFEDVEKWIDEQERYFGKSGSNFDEGTGKSAEKHKDLDLINFNEEKNIDSSPPVKEDLKKSSKTEDDKFLDSLLMDAEVESVAYYRHLRWKTSNLCIQYVHMYIQIVWYPRASISAHVFAKYPRELRTARSLRHAQQT